MSQQIIAVGPAPNDGLGDPLRTAFIKTNNNFTELYERFQSPPPINLIGQAGDVPGMYAVSVDYFYYCYAVYDGTNQIWQRVANENLFSPSAISNGTTSVAIPITSGNVVVSVGTQGQVAQFGPNGLQVNDTIAADTIAANVLNIGQFTAVNLSVTGNTVADGPITSKNTIMGDVIYGNTAVESGGPISAVGNVSTAGYFIGNGSQLTGLTPDRIFLGNSSVNVQPDGNVTTTIAGVANVIIVSPDGESVNANITASQNISAVGNVSGLAMFATNGIALNANTIAADFDFPPGFNGLTVGPLTMLPGVNVTLPAGQDWLLF